MGFKSYHINGKFIVCSTALSDSSKNKSDVKRRIPIGFLYNISAEGWDCETVGAVQQSEKSRSKNIRILTKLFCIAGSNLVTLAWTDDELSRGQTSSLELGKIWLLSYICPWWYS